MVRRKTKRNKMKNKPKVDNKWVEERYRVASILSEGLLKVHHGKVTPVDFIGQVLDLLDQTQQETLEWCLKEVARVGLHFNAERVNGKWCFPEHPHTQLRAKENFQTSLVLEEMRQTIKKRINSLEEKK